MTTRSLFHLASVTKPVVATAILQLVEGGKLDLDDPVVKHVPYFRLADVSSTTITLRQLLTHTSGLPDVEDYDWDKPEYDDEALERYVRGLSTRRMRSAPGSTFSYSNIGFEVLADVIAKVTASPFEEWLAASIFEPVAMTSSTLLYDAVDLERLVAPHSVGPNFRPTVRSVFPYNRRHAASSTLYSNVEDLSRWMLVNLARGELDGKRILAAASYDQLWKPGTPVTNRVGLSWFLGDRGGEATVHHSAGCARNPREVDVWEPALRFLVGGGGRPAPASAATRGLPHLAACGAARRLRRRSCCSPESCRNGKTPGSSSTAAATKATAASWC